MVGVTCGLEVLGVMRNQAEQTTKSKPVSGVRSWPPHQFLPLAPLIMDCDTGV